MIKPIHLLVAALVLTGCSPRNTELAEFIAQTKQEQPGGVEPLPEVRPYESYFYTDQSLRSPFVPGGNADSANAGVRPDVKRNRQFLEQFSLDTLSMVGTLRMGPRQYALVRTSDGLVHRVVQGDYLGQNDGRITAIAPSQINVTEIVPDGLGGYMERTASLALNE